MTGFLKLAERFNLTAFAYAHRGLWTVNGPPENSLAAYRAAAEAGLGIEFDIRPSVDGTPTLFHDTSLDRMTAHTGEIDIRTSEQLGRITLKCSTETIPTFQDLLDMWPAETPLLTELKVDGDIDPVKLAADVSAMVNAHKGPAAIMSFSARAMAAVPDTIMRGLTALSMEITGADKFHARMNQASNMGIDYIVVSHENTELALDFTRKNNLGLAVYTVKTTDELSALRTISNDLQDIGVMFEGFEPALVKTTASQ